jgi:hypothetical protein
MRLPAIAFLVLIANPAEPAERTRAHRSESARHEFKQDNPAHRPERHTVPAPVMSSTTSSRLPAVVMTAQTICSGRRLRKLRRTTSGKEKTVGRQRRPAEHPRASPGGLQGSYR